MNISRRGFILRGTQAVGVAVVGSSLPGFLGGQAVAAPAAVTGSGRLSPKWFATTFQGYTVREGDGKRFSRPMVGKPWTLIRREELCGARKRTSVRPLAVYGHIADPHLTDAQCPARTEFAHSVIPPAYRAASMVGPFALAAYWSVVGVMVVLWGLNGFFQSAGGPCAYNTINRWTSRTRRGRWLGLYNTSHNIGGAVAGIIAFWGTKQFFSGHVAGMLIVLAVLALMIGIGTLWLGKDDPRELGWDTAAEVFDDPDEISVVETEALSKKQIFFQYVLKNPWVLCTSNVFVYIVCIGIDNWAPLYVVEELGFSTADAINTIFFFEMGALLASLTWGMVSDLLKGRRCLVAVIGAVQLYTHATTPLMVNVSLFLLGFLIFGPQLLVAVSMLGFVPKNAVSVANGMTGTFGYLFGDSMAKVGIAAIADPESAGLTILGHTLHGWGSVWVVFYVALVVGIALFAVVAVKEEQKIRALNRPLSTSEQGAEGD